MEGEEIIVNISKKVSKHLFVDNLNEEHKEHDTSYLAFKFIVNKDIIENESEKITGIKRK
jgi:hypothetical protein